MTLKSRKARKEAAMKSQCIVAIITGPPQGGCDKDAFFSDDRCLEELRWARQQGVPIQPIYDISTDARNVNGLLALAPLEFKYLRDEFFPVTDENDKLWTASMNRLMTSMSKLIETSDRQKRLAKYENPNSDEEDESTT